MIFWTMKSASFHSPDNKIQLYSTDISIYWESHQVNNTKVSPKKGKVTIGELMRKTNHRRSVTLLQFNMFHLLAKNRFPSLITTGKCVGVWKAR
jgi:hypothetical protein